MAFERILFRATRGNVYLKQVAVDEPVVDPVSGDKVYLIDSYTRTSSARPHESTNDDFILVGFTD